MGFIPHKLTYIDNYCTTMFQIQGVGPPPFPAPSVTIIYGDGNQDISTAENLTSLQPHYIEYNFSRDEVDGVTSSIKLTYNQGQIDIGDNL